MSYTFAAGLGEKETEFDNLRASIEDFEIFCTKLFHSYWMEEGITC